ncbi:MAG: type VI secretion system baseplate subunit TssF [Bdellovibrionota bacterium]
MNFFIETQNLECTNNKGFDSLNLNSIRFYINLPRELALCLHEQLFCDLIAVILYDTSEKEEKYLGSIYAPHALDLVGFKEDEIVIPRPFQEEDNHLNTHARHLLYEFGQYPEKFMFFDLKGHKNGLQKTLSTCGKNLQLRFFFKENIHRKIEEILHEQNIFCLNAVPVINLLESDAVEEVITESNKSYEINLPEEQNFYHFKHLNVFNFQTKVRGYCTNVEEHPNPTSFEEPLYTWKKNTENKSVVQNELKSFKIDILNFLGEPINLKGLVLEHKVLSMNYLPLDTILQPGALKGLNSLVKSIVPLQTIISDKQKRFPRLEMWHTLKRVPVTPIYYNENRIEILKSFLRGIHFHEEKHTSNLLNLLLEIKTHVSPGSIAFDYPNDTPAKGANFVFEYDNEKNNDARKNGNLVFLNILSELFADNYSDISFVRLHLKYSKQTESSYCSGFVRGKLSL